jgi:8-oxo-dGTP pyrophosphatase MutT (NUDIX family)
MIKATLVLIVKDGKVLLGYKKKGVEEISDILNGPGGKQEAGETLLQCAVREALEEMGAVLDPQALKKIAVITFFAGGSPDFEVHVYWTNSLLSEPAETASMVPEWFAVEAIPYERMLEGDRLWFPLALSGEEKFGANVYYERRAQGLIEMVMVPFPEENQE